jgi:hypothetical protein
VSVPVPVEALQARIEEFGGGAFLITASSEGSVHVVSATPRVEDAVLVVGAGRTTRANLATNPVVTLLWPRSPDGAYSLIVDGMAVEGTGADGDVAITPSRAVLHRLADAPSDGPQCVPIEGPPD